MVHAALPPRGAYVQDKNTSARFWAKMQGGLCARGGYLLDSTVNYKITVVKYTCFMWITMAVLYAVKKLKNFRKTSLGYTASAAKIL